MAFSSSVRRYILLTPKQSLLTPTASYSIDTDGLRPIENANLIDVKRGTGLRSSYNGITCTVFGASGGVGRAVANRLGQRGTQIILPYRGDPYFYQETKLLGDLGQILYTPFELGDEDALRKAMKYSDVVINLIGKDRDTRNFSLEKVHIEGAQRIARIAREMGVKKLIHLSAMGASPTPRVMHVKGGSRFMRTKWHGEQAVRAEFPDAIIVRPSEIYGEYDRYFSYYGQFGISIFNKVFLWRRGMETIKQPIFVGDVAAGLAELVTLPYQDVAGKTYQFVGPRRYLLHDLIKYIFKLMWKDESAKFVIEDSDFHLLFPIMREYYDKAYVIDPYKQLSWERWEREHTTDELDPNLPMIQDLNVKLRFFEDIAYHFLFYYREYPGYIEDPWELEKPTLPIVDEMLSSPKRASI